MEENCLLYSLIKSRCGLSTNKVKASMVVRGGTFQKCQLGMKIVEKLLKKDGAKEWDKEGTPNFGRTRGLGPSP